jgi:hypothetical protein
MRRGKIRSGRAGLEAVASQTRFESDASGRPRNACDSLSLHVCKPLWEDLKMLWLSVSGAGGGLRERP